MKFPMFRQVESMDCGPTCIQMITAYYKKKFPLQTLKEYCNVTRLGISIHDLVNGCNKIGLNAVPIKMPANRIEDLPLPAILYWQQNHFVVLYDLQKTKKDLIFHLCDPSYGRIKLNKEYFIKQWANTDGDGIAIAIEQTEEFNTINIPQNKSTFKKSYYNIIKKHIKKFSFVLFLSSISLITNWFIPILFQKTIDNGIENKDIDLLFLLLSTQLAFFIGNIISTSLTNITLTRINLNIGLDILSKYILKLTKLPISFFDTRLNSDLIQGIDDQQKIQDYITSHLVNFIINATNILIFSSILFHYDKIIFLIYTCLSALALLWVKLFTNKVKILDYSRFIISSENKNTIYDLINGMIEVKINTAQTIKLSSFLKIKKTN